VYSDTKVIPTIATATSTSINEKALPAFARDVWLHNIITMADTIRRVLQATDVPEVIRIEFSSGLNDHLSTANRPFSIQITFLQ
jgi:hypothetical protein